MPKKKFNFSDIMMDTPPVVAGDPVVTVSKGGQLVIPRSLYTQYGLDGKAVKLVWDETKQALGLKEIFVEFESDAWNNKVMRLLKSDAKTGQMRVSIGRVLTRLGLAGLGFKDAPFGKYEPTGLEDDRTTYYVILKKANETV